tara:strand:- start:255 stop:497 length:243 start_codon:yes stop_codon:yes gene_type:complete
MVEARIEDANGFWDDSTKIQFACESADAIIHYLIEKGLVGDEMIHDYEENGKLKTDNDPTGFTEEGRDLFEYIYSLCRFD